jgi:hypothetical protein
VQNVALIRGASAGGGGGHQRRLVQEADGGAPTLSSSVGYGRDRRSASPPPRHHAENPQPALPAASTSPPSSIFSPSKMEVRPPATTAPASFSPRLSPSPAPGAGGISKGVGIEFGGDGGAHHLVSGLVHGGAAEASRRVDVGDAIVEVDGVSVEGMSSTFVSALRESLYLSYPPLRDSLIFSLFSRAHIGTQCPPPPLVLFHLSPSLYLSPSPLPISYSTSLLSLSPSLTLPLEHTHTHSTRAQSRHSLTLAPNPFHPQISQRASKLHRGTNAPQGGAWGQSCPRVTPSRRLGPRSCPRRSD